MDTITGFISTHPAMFVLGVIIAVMLLLNFIFKSLVKLVIVMLFIVLAAFGYYHFHDPNTMPEIVKVSFETMQSGFDDLKDKSKSFFKDSGDLFKKAKDAPGNVNKLLDFSDKDSKK